MVVIEINIIIKKLAKHTVQARHIKFVIIIEVLIEHILLDFEVIIEVIIKLKQIIFIEENFIDFIDVNFKL